MVFRIVRCGVGVLSLTAVMLAGCLESNPQPSPGQGGLDEGDAKGWAQDGVVEADVDGNGAVQVCCDGDESCPGGSRCTGGSSGLPVCLPEPEAGRCWEDNHCSTEEACVGASFCHCSANCETTMEPGVCCSIAVAGCVDEHSCQPCVEGGCVDGHGLIFYYPEEAGEFPDDNYDPPQELLDVAVAGYECNVCECTSGWKILQDAEWLDVDVVGFCEFLVQQDDACGDCLTAWEWEPSP